LKCTSSVLLGVSPQSSAPPCSPTPTPDNVHRSQTLPRLSAPLDRQRPISAGRRKGSRASESSTPAWRSAPGSREHLSLQLSPGQCVAMAGASRTIPPCLGRPRWKGTHRIQNIDPAPPESTMANKVADIVARRVWATTGPSRQTSAKISEVVSDWRSTRTAMTKVRSSVALGVVPRGPPDGKVGIGKGGDEAVKLWQRRSSLGRCSPVSCRRARPGRGLRWGPRRPDPGQPRLCGSRWSRR